MADAPLAGSERSALLLVNQEPVRGQVGRLVEAEPTIARRSYCQCGREATKLIPIKTPYG